MCYDTPKAVHFDAYLDGNLLADNDPRGLLFRWHAAQRVVSRATQNMLCLSVNAEGRIQAALQELNVDKPVTVTLRDHNAAWTTRQDS